MHILGVQFEKQTGPDVVRQYKVTFTIDETQKKPLFDWLSNCEKGSSWMMMLFDAENQEIEEIGDETPKETKTRFQKRMHAMINNKAAEYNKTPEEVKNMVKAYLIKQGYMEKSSKELTVNGYVAAIYYLQNIF